MSAAEIISKLAKVNNLVLSLADAGYEDDQWKKYQYTREGRNVIIDRIENQISDLLNEIEAELMEAQS